MVSFWDGSLKKTLRACDEQFTFAIPKMSFQIICFCDVN